MKVQIIRTVSDIENQAAIEAEEVIKIRISVEHGYIEIGGRGRGLGEIDILSTEGPLVIDPKASNCIVVRVGSR